jgi:hypothetical protein
MILELIVTWFFNVRQDVVGVRSFRQIIRMSLAFSWHSRVVDRGCRKASAGVIAMTFNGRVNSVESKKQREVCQNIGKQMNSTM